VTTHRRLTKTLRPTRPLAAKIDESVKHALPQGRAGEQQAEIPDTSQQPLALLYPLLRVAPIPWPQDLHALTAVHPLWVHVRSGLSRLSGWVGS